MIARQEVICRKACAVPLATCFAASASNAATKGLTAALLSFSQIPGLLVWVSATYRRPNSFCIVKIPSRFICEPHDEESQIIGKSVIFPHRLDGFVEEVPDRLDIVWRRFHG